MPAYRLSRSFSAFNLRSPTDDSHRPSTSLGRNVPPLPGFPFAFSASNKSMPALVGGPASKPRTGRPHLLTLLSKRSFSSFTRAPQKSPTYSTFSTSSFGSLARPGCRRSSSDGQLGRLQHDDQQQQQHQHQQRFSGMPWNSGSLRRLSIDADPFASAPPSPVVHCVPCGRAEIDRCERAGWLGAVILEDVGSFEDELTDALSGVVSRRATPDGQHGRQSVLKLGPSAPSSPSQPWYLLAHSSAATPSICISPPDSNTLDVGHSPFTRAQNEVLSATSAFHEDLSCESIEINATLSLRQSEYLHESAYDGIEDDGVQSTTPPVSPTSPARRALPEGLLYATAPVCSTPRLSASDPQAQQTALTPLLTSLLLLGEDEGRDLIEPLELDWSSGSSYGGFSDADADDDDGNTMQVDSPVTPATPFNTLAYHRGGFEREPGLSPSPGRIEFARTALIAASEDHSGDEHFFKPREIIRTRSLLPLAAIGENRALETPSPPMRVNKTVPLKPLDKRLLPTLLADPPKRSSSLASSDAKGKENGGGRVRPRADTPRWKIGSERRIPALLR